MTTFIIGAFSLIIFIFFVIYKVGVLPSLSDSYFELQKLRNWYKYLFQLSLAIASFCLSASMLTASEDSPFQFLAFLTAAPILFVAAAPNFKTFGLERNTHIAAATGSGIMSAMWVVLMGYWYIIPISCSLAMIGYYFKQQKTWWAEMACFLWTLITCFLILI
jgi:hypothetical protein